MIKPIVNNKIPTPPLTNIYLRKGAKFGSSSCKEGSKLSKKSRFDQLSLPPIRTLIQNQEQYKHILKPRAAEALDRKIKQTMFSQYGRAQDNYGPDIIFEKLSVSRFIQPPQNRKPLSPICNVANASKKPLTQARIDILSKPLERKIASAVCNHHRPENSISTVKPSALSYVANERILQLAEPKQKKRWTNKKLRSNRSKKN